VQAWHFDPGADPRHGAEVLRRSAATVGATRLLHDIRLPAGSRPEATVHEALLAGGFTLEVERLELVWRAASGLPRDPGRLRYRPARELGPAAMLDAMRRVAVGSLDHDTKTELAAGRGEQDAVDAYEYVTTCGGEPHWFEFGYLGEELVGFVVPAVQPGWAQIAYIGVFPEHRGHGYIDDLLARGTATLAAAGIDEVAAGTDTGNAPMAAAFARAGYADAGRVFRYYWRAD
jgi:ribosomal protein S18 acetylase RimI-like enzyme